MAILRRRGCAVLFLATGSTFAGETGGASAKIPVVSVSDLTTINQIISLAPTPRITVLPVDSPPVNGFTPQVAYGLTDRQFPNDETFTSHMSSAPEGNVLAKGGTPYYSTAVFDTGSQSHLIDFTDAGTMGFNIDGTSGRAGDMTQTVSGASGSEDATVSDPLGVYITGLANASVNGSGSVQVATNTLTGQTNTSVLYKESSSDLPSIIGAPMIAQYQAVIKNSQTTHITVGGQAIRSPQINLQALDTALPNGYFKLWNDVLSVNGVTPDPVFIPSIENLNNFIDNPTAQTIWASLFADTNLTNGGGSVNEQQFLFDTGAEVSVISEQTAAKLGIFTTGPNAKTPDFFSTVTGVGGTTQQVPGYFVDNLTVITNGGPITWNHVPVLLLDVIDPRDAVGYVPGILGMNLFTDRDLIVNGGMDDPFVGIGPEILPQWIANASGLWSEDQKWSLGSPDGADVQANFLSSITSPQTITVDGSGYTVGSMKFDNANHYTIAGA